MNFVLCTLLVDELLGTSEEKGDCEADEHERINEE